MIHLTWVLLQNKTLPPLNKFKNESWAQNFDLTEKDIDKSHSPNAIDYMMTSLNKMKILNEGQSILNKYTHGGETTDNKYLKSSSKNYGMSNSHYK